MKRLLAAIFRPVILFILVVGGCGFLIGAFVVGKEVTRATIFEVTVVGILMLVAAFSSLTGFFLLLSRW